MQYFGKRYYAPLLNRWVSADPLAVHALGADSNVYAYVSGRALKSIDPRGLADEGEDLEDAGVAMASAPKSEEIAGEQRSLDIAARAMESMTAANLVQAKRAIAASPATCSGSACFQTKMSAAGFESEELEMSVSGASEAPDSSGPFFPVSSLRLELPTNIDSERSSSYFGACGSTPPPTFGTRAMDSGSNVFSLGANAGAMAGVGLTVGQGVFLDVGKLSVGTYTKGEMKAFGLQAGPEVEFQKTSGRSNFEGMSESAFFEIAGTGVQLNRDSLGLSQGVFPSVGSGYSASSTRVNKEYVLELPWDPVLNENWPP